jgi:23S rRNA (cytidine2498-2'-O)-methyltransferase
MLAHPDARSILVLCRPGMEGDAAAELVAIGSAQGSGGWCRTGDGWVEYVPVDAGDLGILAARVPFVALVFARQWMAQLAERSGLSPQDRATPLASAAAASIDSIGALRVEHPDSESGRPLARLARGLEGPLHHALAAAGVRTEKGGPVLHVVLSAGDSARIGLSDPGNSAPWPAGIPRLRAPKAAPSRSVLKLEEALALFLNDDERAAWLRPGRTAVDLGAAPGGWTWLLAERGLKVVAVDNGALAEGLRDHPRVQHQRTDGFRYRPAGPVDWLVCDMVEQPHRIVRLVARWLAEGQCRHVVTNLKLPMKQRWPTVAAHLEALAQALPPEGRLAARQLYHDREEVTVFATRAPLG